MNQKAVFWSLGGLALLFATLFCAQEYVYRGRMPRAIQAKTRVFEDRLPMYRKMQETYAGVDAFKPVANQRDAGPFLNPRVLWVNASGVGAYEKSKQPVTHIPILEKVGETDLQWGSSRKFDFALVDFSALQTLLGYDYWDINSSPFLQEFFEELRKDRIAADFFFEKLPRPDFHDLIQVSKLRLMYGMKTGRLLTAMKEVRHVAHLCYSTETITGFRAALQILSTEADAYRYAVQKNMIQPGAWSPTPGDLKKLDSEFLQTVGYYGMYSTPELIALTLADPPNTMGRCTSIQASMALLSKFHPYFTGISAPFERERDQLLGSLRQVALDPQNGCRLPYVRAYWEQQLQSVGQTPLWTRIAQPFPYLRRGVGLYLMFMELLPRQDYRPLIYMGQQ